MKLTKHLTGYLKNNYKIGDHRKDSKYSFWNDDYIEYKKENDKYIKKAESIVVKNAKNNNTTN